MYRPAAPSLTRVRLASKCRGKVQLFPPSWSKRRLTEAFEALRAGRQPNLRFQGRDVFVRLLRSSVHLPCRTRLNEGHIYHSDIRENLAQVGLQRVKPFSRRSRLIFACARDDHRRLLTAEKAFIAAISIHFESNSATNDVVYVSFKLGWNSVVIHGCCDQVFVCLLEFRNQVIAKFEQSLLLLGSS